MSVLRGYKDSLLILADKKNGTIIIERQHSRRIQTRTKGKRMAKRLVKEYVAKMEARTKKLEWDIFHYTAMGKYP